MKLQTHVLRDWPEDRLPCCAAADCGREIANGQRYVILAETLKLVCQPCSVQEERVKATHQAGLDVEIAQLPQKEQIKRGVKRTQLRARARARPRMPAQPRKSRYVRKDPSTHGKSGLPFKYPPHPCKACGVVFQPRALERKAQIYCTFACSIEGRWTVGRPRPCPACDRMFQPKSTRPGQQQTCCSRSCARWWIPRGLRNPSPPSLLWSQSWGLTGCRACGRSDRRHRGQGYCPSCYRKLRAAPGGPRKAEPNSRRSGQILTIAS